MSAAAHLLPPSPALLLLLALQGRLAAEAEAHSRNVADLQRFLQQICAQAGVTPADGAPSRTDARSGVSLCLAPRSCTARAAR